MKSCLKRRNFVAVLVCMAVLGFGAEVAKCETIIVKADGTGDYPTIQEAINDSNGGDIIELQPGTYIGINNRDIDFLGKAITVRSTDPNDPNIAAATVIDCGMSYTDPHRGFNFYYGEGPNSVLAGITITNGYGPRYKGDWVGGAILCDDSSPTITNCNITDNIAQDGGGIWCWNSNAIITNCTITGGLAADGGGIYCHNSSPTITNCTVTGNTVHGAGGAIFCRLSDPNITSCKITDNSAGGGGAIYCYDSSPTVTDCVISDNSTDGDGGGIFGCMGPITNCIITGNSAEGDGGGLYHCDGTIKNCIIADNKAERDGGGFYDGPGPLINCVINNNTARSGGGVSFCWGPITNCTIAGNRAENEGGLHFCDGPITNCIIWDNLPHQLYGSPSITYSNIQGGWPGEGNIDAEPLLTLDGHLRAGSVCIDAGDPNDDFPDQLDIDGEPRVMGAYVDMGGDEFFDTDDDGLPDWWETKYFGSTTAAEPNDDPDMDSYTNLTEYEIYSSDPTVAAKIYYVDANQPDDTGDGLSWDIAKRTIQAAIDAADNSDKVIIAQGTYTGLGNCDLDPGGRAIVIQSIDPNDPNIVAGTIINPGHGISIGFYFQNGETAECIVSGLTITNCSDREGAIYCKNTSPTIKNCTISENGGAGISCYESSPTINNCTISENEGAGIFCYKSSPTINNCIITGNWGGPHGGSIYCYNSSPTITNCTISDNSTEGIYCEENSSPTITNCTISDNSTWGIYFYCEPGSSLTIKNCTITKNHAGIYCRSMCNATITNSTISENISGGIMWRGNLKIDNSTITDNSSPFGSPGICCTGDSLTIKSCTITGNSSYSDGGGIYSSAESLTINNCTITGNSAGHNGGGIYSKDSDPNITNCTISGNSAEDSGGGIFCDGDLTITNSAINNNSAYLLGGISCRDTTLTNCTITGNSAEFIGGLACGGQGGSTITNCIISGNFAEKICGGIFFFSGDGNPIITNSTITGNMAGEHSGGIHCGFSNLTINNCILWGNEAFDGPQIYLERNANVSVSYTDVQGGQADVYVEPGGVLNWGLGNIDLDPYFVDPNASDHHLSEDSPCIDAGDPNFVPEPNETDLDGNPRIIGGRVDMGAYEFNHLLVACIVDGDRTFEARSGCEARVTLDGSCSSDADSTPGTNDDIEYFDWYEGDTLLGTGQIIDCNLSLGEHIIVLEVTDKAGAFDANEVTIIVEDTTPPEFALSVTPTTLWPPNHRMVKITPSWEVSDNCDESLDVTLVSITMDEEDDAKGAGHTSDDIRVNDKGIWLRAERSGKGTGRVYTITYQAVDDSGNVAEESTTVTVPHSRARSKLRHRPLSRLRYWLLRRLRSRLRRYR